MGWGEFLRVKIKLDMSKPLAQGRMLKIKDKSVWIAFQYEKIPNFYFRCGIIQHGVIGCLQSGRRRSLREGAENQYGSWLRVTSPGRRHDNRKGSRGSNTAAQAMQKTTLAESSSHRDGML